MSVRSPVVIVPKKHRGASLSRSPRDDLAMYQIQTCAGHASSVAHKMQPSMRRRATLETSTANEHNNMDKEFLEFSFYQADNHA